VSKKTVNYNKEDIKKIPTDKPVVYKILTENNKTNYAGSAKRGRVQERIIEHISNIQGVKVQIEQMPSIDKAKEKESNIISRNKPKYNETGK